MKQFLLVLALILIASLTVFGQFVDPRLQVKYSENEIQSISYNHPNELNYLNWYLDNSFVIIDMSVEKCEYLPYLKHYDPSTKTVGENVSEISEENFNVLLFSYERKYDKSSTYRIGNSGKAIVFLSEKDLVSNFNKHQYGK
jgi:hypothetical protein